MLQKINKSLNNLYNFSGYIDAFFLILIAALDILTILLENMLLLMILDFNIRFLRSFQ